MGKAQKLLTIVVTDPAMLEWVEIKKLESQGHMILSAGMPHVDMVMGPDCWMMDETLRPFLKHSIKAARDKKYTGKGVSHGLEDTQVLSKASAQSAEDSSSGPGDDKAGATQSDQ